MRFGPRDVNGRSKDRARVAGTRRDDHRCDHRAGRHTGGRARGHSGHQPRQRRADRRRRRPRGRCGIAGRPAGKGRSRRADRCSCTQAQGSQGRRHLGPGPDEHAGAEYRPGRAAVRGREKDAGQEGQATPRHRSSAVSCSASCPAATCWGGSTRAPTPPSARTSSTTFCCAACGSIPAMCMSTSTPAW
jgi:hypothetical protein